MAHQTSLPNCDLPYRQVKLINSMPVNPSHDLIINLLTHNMSLFKVTKALVLIHKACRTWRADPTPDKTWSSIKNSISASVLQCFVRESEIIIATNKMKHLVIQLIDGIYYVSDRSFRFSIRVPLVCKKTILAKCIVKDAHTELRHGRDFLQVLSHIQSKFFIPGVRKMVTDMRKSCLGCIKINKKPFAAFKADVPNVLKSVQPPFCYCQADIFGPVLAHQGEVQLKRWILVTLCLAK